MPCWSVSGVGSGMQVGHGRAGPGGFGNGVVGSGTRGCSGTLPFIEQAMSRARCPSSRHSIWLVTITSSFTYSPTGSAWSIVFL